MGTKNVSPGFHSINRRDGIFQEKVHDTYKIKAKLPEPTVCSQCGAVYHEGRWLWRKAPADAHQHDCPACLRIHDHFPAGYLTLQGDFLSDHHDEISHLVRNVEKREQVEHALKRIMAVKEQDDGTMLITTTDIHLARGIGEAIHHAYQGDLEFHYNPDENLLRVYWSR